MCSFFPLRSVPVEGRRGDVLAGVGRAGEPDVHVAGDVDCDAAERDRQDSSQGRQGRAIHHALCQRSGEYGISSGCEIMDMAVLPLIPLVNPDIAEERG